MYKYKKAAEAPKSGRGALATTGCMCVFALALLSMTEAYATIGVVLNNQDHLESKRAHTQ